MSETQALRRGTGGDLMKIFEGPTEESLDERQRQLVRRGREAFTELERLLKNLTLYGAGHQSIDRFRQRFQQAITALLAGEAEVVVKIGPYDFLICEQSVYQNQSPEKNFVYRFFQDGVRALRFREGVEPREIDALVDIVLTNWDDPALFEDDVVTLLWEREFEHVEYDVVDSFAEELDTGGGDYTVEGVIEHVRQGADEAAGLAPGASADDDLVFVGDDSLGGTGGSGGGVRSALARATITEQDLERFQEHPFAMDEHEFHTLRHIHDASGRETLEKFIEILFKVCLAEEDATERERLSSYFQKIAGLLLDGGRIGELKRILLKLRGLTGPEGELLLENVAAINDIFERWSTPDFAARLVALYNEPRFDQPGAVLDLCRLLNPSAAVHLAREAGRVTIGDRRQALFETLTDGIGAHIREVGRLMQTVDAAHAHDLLRILRRFDHPDVQSAISAALSNADAAVRLEALAAVPVERAHVHLRFIQAALSDTSKVVRSKALHLLAQMRLPQVHTYLMQRLREKDFAQLELDEKRKYFVVAALTGDPTEYFLELFTSRGLFSRGAGDDLRACAAIGLAVRLHRDAIPHLQRELTRRLGSDVVRIACTWALQHMASDRDERRRQFYDLFFRGELTAGGTPAL